MIPYVKIPFNAQTLCSIRPVLSQGEKAGRIWNESDLIDCRIYYSGYNSSSIYGGAA